MLIKKIYSKKRPTGRNAGIDLCRILGMIDIIVFHIVIGGNLYSRFSNYKKRFRYIEIISQWHISSFGIISGVVGFKAYKYSNLLYLYLCVLLYSLTIHYVVKKYLKNIFGFNYFNERQPKDYYFPVISNSYWYFTTYFGMYLFLPLITKGLSLVDKAELGIIILSLLGILLVWKDIMCKEPQNFNSDTSFTTLSIYFILGAYIGKYNLDKTKKGIFYFLFWIMVCCSTSYYTCYLEYYIGNNKINLFFKKIFHGRSCSIAMIIQSFSLVLIFSKIQYNKTIAKIISFFGPLSFSAYLIHNHMDLRGILFPFIFKNISSNLSFKYLLFLIIGRGTLVFLACMLIDYIRNLLFTILRIKKICAFIEKMIFSVTRIITREKNNYLKI